jgi:hypothetical protein
MAIDMLLKEGYHQNILLNLQQRGSKLADCVRVETQNVEKYFYDKIVATTAQDVLSRHGDTPLIETKFDRRMISLITSDWGDLIDREDKLNMLSDPTSVYVLNASYALGRKKDQRIIEAALGSAYSGNKGDQKVPLPEEQKIATNFVEGGAPADCGLTIDKLRMARQILDDADVDDDEEQFCVVSARQIHDLLKTTEVTSEDYNTVRALVDGKINTFMGFKFKRVSSSLLPRLGNNRNVFCFAKSGLLFASAGDIKTDITTRADKRMATQVYASISCGAVRLDEKKVIQISCKE